MDRKSLSVARQHFQNALKVDLMNVNARILLALCEYLEKNYKGSRRTFEKVLQECDSRNVYCLCAVGNLNLNFARADLKQASFVHFDWLISYSESVSLQESV